MCFPEEEQALKNLTKTKNNQNVTDTLEWYANQFCEGWCKESPPDADFDDCAGCKARLTLRVTKTTENARKNTLDEAHEIARRHWHKTGSSMSEDERMAHQTACEEIMSQIAALRADETKEPTR